MTITVREIVVAWLKEYDYDGLSFGKQCKCDVDNLGTCVEGPSMDCEARSGPFSGLLQQLDKKKLSV